MITDVLITNTQLLFQRILFYRHAHTNCFFNGYFFHGFYKTCSKDKSAAEDETDYECDNGVGWVENLASPVWSPENTDEACWSNSACDSGVCLVTNVTDATLGHKV